MLYPVQLSAILPVFHRLTLFREKGSVAGNGLNRRMKVAHHTASRYVACFS